MMAANPANRYSSQPRSMGHAETSRLEALDHEETTPVAPPDGGYGWVIVGSCFTLNAFTWGVTAVSLLA